MLIVEALNRTPDGEQNGLADYDVRVMINDLVIWKGLVTCHIRKAGASALLRLVANRMEC